MICHACSETYIKIEEKIFKCSFCGHIFRNYQKDPVKFHKEEYRKLFKKDQQEFDLDGKVNNKFHQARREMVNKRIEIIKPILEPNYDCLDIGAGAGTFARTVLKHVKSVECTELDKNLINEIKRFGIPCYDQSFFDINFNKSYDIVFAWHVLEHVINAKMFVEKMKKLSAKYIVIEVPCDRKVSKQFDGHFHLFNKKSLFLLLQTVGIDNVEITEGVQKPAILAICKI